jgi:hypothetical protein
MSRTYHGGKATLAIIAATVVVVSGINLAAKAARDKEPRAPRPAVTTVVPSTP